MAEIIDIIGKIGNPEDDKDSEEKKARRAAALAAKRAELERYAIPTDDEDDETTVIDVIGGAPEFEPAVKIVKADPVVEPAPAPAPVPVAEVKPAPVKQAAPAEPAEPEGKKPIYPEMRKLVFGLHRADGNPFERNSVNAIMFETNDGEKVFSIVMTADGNASMYFDDGKIAAGLGKGDPNIARTAAVICRRAQSVLDKLSKTIDTCQPAPYHRAIYIITDGGPYRTITPTDSLEGLDETQSYLTGLYAVASNVIHNSPLLKRK